MAQRGNQLERNWNHEEPAKAMLMEKGKISSKDPNAPDFDEIVFDSKFLVPNEKINSHNRGLVVLANQLCETRNAYIEAKNTFQGKQLRVELGKIVREFFNIMAMVNKQRVAVENMNGTPYPFSRGLCNLPQPLGTTMKSVAYKGRSVDGKKIRKT